MTLSPHPDSSRFPNHSWFSTGTGGPNLDDYLKDRFNLDLLCASQGRLVWRECSNNVVIKVNLCLSCCASNKFQSFRYLKILLLSIYYYSLFLWANVSARYKHHAWSLKCSENANELDLSTRASLKHGMVYKTRKKLWGNALNIVDSDQGFRKQPEFNLIEAKQTFTFLYWKNHWEVHALDLICNVSLSKSFRRNKSTSR